MNRILKYILCAVMSLALTACGTEKNTADNQESISSYSIVATVFPAWDWVREILGENPGNIQLTFLLDSGSDLHSYQPTAADMVKVAECDMFVYVGGESDQWTADAIKESVNPGLKAISLMEILSDSVKEEEIIEGMQAEEEGEEETEYDEHVWLSLPRAQQAVTYLAEAIAGMDPANAEIYTANAAAYCEELTLLDQQYRETVDGAKVKTLIFADRFPFRYLCDDYGIRYYAAFAGCSAETEASFETIRFLAGRMDELGLDHVITIENNDEKIARTVIENTAAKDNMTILHLDSLQAADAAAAKAGVTYLSVMRDNLSVLAEALGQKE